MERSVKSLDHVDVQVSTGFDPANLLAGNSRSAHRLVKTSSASLLPFCR